MEPATIFCGAIATLALGSWLASRAGAALAGLPHVFDGRIPGRAVATAMLAVIGFVAAPRPSGAEPIPPIVRLAERQPPDAPPATVQEVVRGDSLWCIAAGVLRQRTGEAPSSADIARFWPQIHAANADLIGNDSDLIHPGQRLTIPEP